jgi:OOP family OmpA-OmpF porin
MKRKGLIAILAIGGAAVTALPAAAQTAYVGAGIGQSKAKDGCTGVGGSGITCEDTDTAFKIFGGYKVNQNFSAEFGYSNLGEVKASGFGNSVAISSTVWELSAIGSIPVAEGFSIFGRLGGYHGETEISGLASGSETTTDLTYGIGLQYDINKNFGLRGEWQRYSKIKARNQANGATGESDVDVLGISFVYRFQ